MSDQTIYLHTTVTVPDVTAEMQLPDTLTIHDRCHKCRAQAHHAFTYELTNGTYDVILLCNHHGREHHATSNRWAAHHDYRMPLLDWEKECSAQRQRAVNDKTGKTSPDPITPAHLVMWDLEMWA